MNQFNPRWLLATLPQPVIPLVTPPIGRVTGLPRRPIRRRPVKRSKRRAK